MSKSVLPMVAVSAIVSAVKAQFVAQEKAAGKVWTAVVKAAGSFPANMSAADKKALSGELAKRYEAEGFKSAAVIASQQARAVHLIATRAKPAGAEHAPDPVAAGNIASFLELFAVKKAAQADAGNAPDNSAGTADAKAASQEKPAIAASTAGLPVELGSAFVRLIEWAKKGGQPAQDAILYMANHADAIVPMVETALAQSIEGKAAKLRDALTRKAA